MFARARITHGVPEKVEEGVRQFRDVVIPAYKDLAGFKGGYMLVDRKKGKLIRIPLFPARYPSERQLLRSENHKFHRAPDKRSDRSSRPHRRLAGSLPVVT